MSILFLVNPAAGNGRAERDWPAIAQSIKEDFKEFDYEFTQRPLHATELAKNAVLKGYETIVSCGGDGTLNEVINGVCGSDVRIALLPLGTGSDFGKSIGIRSVREALLALKSGKSERVDIAKVEFGETGQSRMFINVLEIGFGAEVMRFVNSHTKRGSGSFVSGILSTVWKLKKFSTALDPDESKYVDTIEVIVANGKYFGGGMLASPKSEINDGVLDVHILRPVSRLTTIIRLRSLMNGTYIDRNYSYENKVKSIRFSQKGNLVEMDGEVIGNTPLSIEVDKKGINFVVP